MQAGSAAAPPMTTTVSFINFRAPNDSPNIVIVAQGGSRNGTQSFGRGEYPPITGPQAGAVVESLLLLLAKPCWWRE